VERAVREPLPSLPLTPEGQLVFCALASLPDTGIAFAINGDGEAILRLTLDPSATGGLTEILQALRQRTFYVALVAKPKGGRDVRGTEQDATEPVAPETSEAAQAARPRRRRRDGGAAGKPDRRTH